MTPAEIAATVEFAIVETWRTGFALLRADIVNIDQGHNILYSWGGEPRNGTPLFIDFGHAIDLAAGARVWARAAEGRLPDAYPVGARARARQQAPRDVVRLAVERAVTQSLRRRAHGDVLRRRCNRSLEGRDQVVAFQLVDGANGNSVCRTGFRQLRKTQRRRPAHRFEHPAVIRTETGNRLRVEQVGGAACHTGKRNCFFRRIDGGRIEDVGVQVFDPDEVYKK